MHARGSGGHVMAALPDLWTDRLPVRQNNVSGGAGASKVGSGREGVGGNPPSY